ncbi:Phospholipase ytpA [Delftia tsuruhatensis]|uniref:alpha/beta hydrolase n=1 Tax=Delftia tsuruhatensis TaxID=180282 RepID=UPI001E6A7684|nr:alpha/beta hydrolase [Delftia tsuruhatensis]CAB5706116.1 Phospholipase ytpA [Delftia tsuruhatensis]CAC9693870.1 Phospholipase ytpA [Delftia tsuruhatensis]
MTDAPVPAPDGLAGRLPGCDGAELALRDWPVAGGPARATVLLVHGLGEHIGRYAALAQRLNAWGYAVRGYDHYGHGRSAGPRGGLTGDSRLLDDLACVVDATRAQQPAGLPLVLLGHSLGGLVAALFVARALRPVDALVLSSPAFDIGLSPLQRLLVGTLPRLLPDLRVSNGLQIPYLSHDAAVCDAYRADPLCHDRICARLARFLAQGGPQVLALAGRWSVPGLLLWAGDDRLVAPAGSRAFADRAPPAVLQAQCFDGAYHELFNESDAFAAPVFARLRDWLGRFSPA